MKALLLVGVLGSIFAARGQPQVTPAPAAIGQNAPLPDPAALLTEVERNQKHLEAEQRDYTYHVHTESVELKGDGSPRKTETTDAESLTIDGIRVDRLTARNGQPLTPDQQARESKRIDDAVARGKERRARAAEKGQNTDPQGHPELSIARILELGSFGNERRTDLNGRPTLVLNYVGNPAAKTHSPFETVFRDLTGNVWIDEIDRVLVRGQGQLVRDFKLGGGLLADVHKGTQFDFRARRVDGTVWLPSTIDASGSARVLLLANFHGKLHLQTSDYRRFRASATILGSHGVTTPEESGESPDILPQTPVTQPPAAPQNLGGPQPSCKQGKG